MTVLQQKPFSLKNLLEKSAVKARLILMTDSPIILTHKIAISPTDVQEEYLRQSAGAARFAYNWGLAKWKEIHAEEKAKKEAGLEYSSPTENGIRKLLNAVKAEKYPWMYAVSKCCQQESIRNLGEAFQRFFRKQGGYPKFKKRAVRRIVLHKL